MKELSSPSLIAATDLNGVRNHLLDVFNALRAGEIDAKVAVEINNTAGKMISACKVQLAYHAMRSERPQIPFISEAVVNPAAPALYSPKE